MWIQILLLKVSLDTGMVLLTWMGLVYLVWILLVLGLDCHLQVFIAGAELKNIKVQCSFRNADPYPAHLTRIRLEPAHLVNRARPGWCFLITYLDFL